jgi:hypothetical protein
MTSYASLDALRVALPAPKTCHVVEVLVTIPGGDPEVQRSIIAGVDSPYAASSDLAAEVNAWSTGDERTRLETLARARGGALSYRIRPRFDPLQRELAALRRLQRATLYGE